MDAAARGSFIIPSSSLLAKGSAPCRASCQLAIRAQPNAGTARDAIVACRRSLNWRAPHGLVLPADSASWQLALRWTGKPLASLDGLSAEDLAWPPRKERPGFLFETGNIPSRSVPAYRACFVERAAALREPGLRRLEMRNSPRRKASLRKIHRTAATYPKTAGYFKMKNERVFGVRFCG